MPDIDFLKLGFAEFIVEFDVKAACCAQGCCSIACKTEWCFESACHCFQPYPNANGFCNGSSWAIAFGKGVGEEDALSGVAIESLELFANFTTEIIALNMTITNLDDGKEGVG